MKRHYKSLLIIIFISLGLSIFGANIPFMRTSKASAANYDYCGLLAPPKAGAISGGTGCVKKNGSSYDQWQNYGTCTVLNGSFPSGCGGANPTSDSLKQQFKTRLSDFALASNQNDYQRISARWIIAQLGPNWKQNIYNPNITLSLSNVPSGGYLGYAFTKNTEYKPYTPQNASCSTLKFPITYTNNGCVYQFDETNYTDRALIVKISGDPNPLFVIKLDCGNPIGTLKKLPDQVDIKGKIYYYDKTNNTKKPLKDVQVRFGYSNGSISTGPNGDFTFNNMNVGTDFRVKVDDPIIIGGITYKDPVVSPDRYGPPLQTPSGNPTCNPNSNSYINQTANNPSSGNDGCRYGLKDNGGYNIAYTSSIITPDIDFTYDPQATIDVSSGTVENPSGVDLKGDSHFISTVPCAKPVTVTYKLTLNGGAPIHTKVLVFPANCVPDGPLPTDPGVAVPAVSAGDQLCLTVTIDPWSGKTDSSGTVKPKAGGPKSDKKCLDIYNEPFFQVDHGSVFAGGEFADLALGCIQPGTLGGWFNNSGAFYGSGTQLAAIANGSGGSGLIKGFASGLGSYGQSFGAAPKGAYLSFANATVNSNDNDPTLGGDFDTAHCISSPQSPPTNSAGGALTSVAPGTYAYNNNLKIDLNTTISGTTTIFVNDHDVFIKKDIIYNAPGLGWPIGSVPSFKLVVKGGNIYIDDKVKELDGTYIAKNSTSSTNKGQIFTCSKDSGGVFAPIDENELFDKCNKKQLVVYGSFVADKINLLRTHGSIRDMSNGKTGQATSKCSNQHGGFTPIANIAPCAAEVFEYSPELFLSMPSGSTKFDAITTLPPIL